MCPFLELSLPPCGAHLTMGAIESAYAHCADRYDTCPVYTQLVLRPSCPTDDLAHDNAVAHATG